MAQIYTQFPWVGGRNTSVDSSLIDPGQLTIADNVIFDTRGSRKKRPAIDFFFDNATASTSAVIAGKDYWYDSGSSKNQRIVTVDDQGRIYSTTISGTRTNIFQAAQVQEVTVSSQGAISAADYFNISSADNSTQYYVWYDTTGAAADPSVSGRTGIEIEVSGVSAASDIAAATASAINAISDFSATASGDVVTITNAAVGPSEHANTGAGLSGFSYETTTIGAKAWTSPSNVVFTTFNNKLFMAANGNNNKLKVWDGSAAAAYNLEDDPDLGSGTPPNASVIGTHLGRLWANDKTDKDRAFYCETFNHLQWGGYGDSGAIDIGQGDGDPEGITAFFPTFKGSLYIGKRRRLYRLVNNFPETFQILGVSEGIGVVAPNSIAPVDQDDLIFASERGFHSLVATEQFGDFQSKFLSTDIQKSYNDDVVDSDREIIQGIWISRINSYVAAVSDSDVGSNDNCALWLYNLPLNTWYRWRFNGALESRNFRSIFRVKDTDQERFFIGSNNNKVAKALVSSNDDKDPAEVSVPVVLNIKTGIIYVDGNPYTQKFYKKFALIYRPTGDHEVTVEFDIDGLTGQSLAFQGSDTADLLGVDFILDQSTLGSSFPLEPQTRTMEGRGGGIQLTITQSGSDEELEIQGFQIIWEAGGAIQQTQLTTGGNDT